MRKNAAGFKQSTRICPGCNTLQTFPERQKACSVACGYKVRGKNADPATSEPKEKEQHEQKGDSWTISLDATRIKTLEQLIEHCEVDTRIWEVERFVCNKWEVGAKYDEGLRIEPLFQVKAWFKKRPNIAAAIDEIASLKAAAKLAAPVLPPIIRPHTPTGNILELSNYDAHFGKLAWGVETGYSDYDLDIAGKCYTDAIAALLSRVSHFSLDKIILVLGNDLFHTDNRAGTTTRGTQVDTDSRYHKVFRRVRELIASEISKLRTIAPVLVKVVPGNHDEQTAWQLGDSLECWFHQASDVTIDNLPTPRKYMQHGRVMLMWTHGDKGKRQDFPLLMATEQPAMWGATIFREAHTAHRHTTKTEEFHGVRVRILPSLAGTDYWHASHGFTGNIRSSEAYLWNAGEGLISTATYAIPDIARAA